jgi:hypothetical protein
VTGKEQVAEKERAAEKEDDPDVTLLREAKIQTDEASLIAFVQKRTVKDEDRLQIDSWVRQLGSDRFAERESAAKDLIRVGRLALLPLHKARKTNDPETKQRVEGCLKGIPPDKDWWLSRMVVRRLLKLGTVQGAECLLGYLASTRDDVEVEDI